MPFDECGRCVSIETYMLPFKTENWNAQIVLLVNRFKAGSCFETSNFLKFEFQKKENCSCFELKGIHWIQFSS